jgi:hypothetical protein
MSCELIDKNEPVSDPHTKGAKIAVESSWKRALVWATSNQRRPLKMSHISHIKTNHHARPRDILYVW